MSAIIQAFTVSAKPGRYDEAVEQVKEAVEFFRGRGAKVRVLRAIEAGSASGTGIITHEYESATAWAATVDSADEEMEAVRDRIRRGDGAVEIHGMSLYQVAGSYDQD